MKEFYIPEFAPDRKPWSDSEWELIPHDELYVSGYTWLTKDCMQTGTNQLASAVGITIGQLVDNGDFGNASIRAFARLKSHPNSIANRKPKDWLNPWD